MSLSPQVDTAGNLMEKLNSGEPLTKEEQEDMREYIESLRATAGYLIRTANDLEQQLNDQSV